MAYLWAMVSRSGKNFHVFSSSTGKFNDRMKRSLVPNIAWRKPAMLILVPKESVPWSMYLMFWDKMVAVSTDMIVNNSLSFFLSIRITYVLLHTVWHNLLHLQVVLGAVDAFVHVDHVSSWLQTHPISVRKRPSHTLFTHSRYLKYFRLKVVRKKNTNTRSDKFCQDQPQSQLQLLSGIL